MTSRTLIKEKKTRAARGRGHDGSYEKTRTRREPRENKETTGAAGGRGRQKDKKREKRTIKTIKLLTSDILKRIINCALISIPEGN